MKLYHAPHSRSSRILWLLEELNLQAEVVKVAIPRLDGSGGPDPANPHPDRKVPALIDKGALITESIAIMQYLCEQRPDSGLMPRPNDAERGPWLSWMAWYAGVYEPVIGFTYAGVADNPVLHAGFRGRAEVDARILEALHSRPYLVGDSFSAVDLLFASAGGWAREILPAGKEVDAWLETCLSRPANARAAEREGTP